MKTYPTPVNQRKALLKALKPYRRWDEWVRSSGCFLNGQDIDLICIYRQTGSYAACKQQLHIGIIDAANRLIYLILRLKASLSLYQDWEQGQRSLYDLVSFAGINTVEDLKAVTYHDLQDCLKGEHRLASTRKPP